jgi:hypothetical protein
VYSVTLSVILIITLTIILITILTATHFYSNYFCSLFLFITSDLQALGLAVPLEILHDVYLQYTTKPPVGVIYVEPVVTLDQWLLIVEDSLENDLRIEEEKKTEKVRLAREAYERKKNMKHWELEEQREREREIEREVEREIETERQIKMGSKLRRGRATTARSRRSTALPLSTVTRGTESSSRRSLSVRGIARADVCDSRARSTSSGNTGVRGGVTVAQSRHISPSPFSSSSRRFKGTAGEREPGPGLGLGLGSGSRQGAAVRVGSDGVFVPSFTDGGMKTRVGQYNRTQKHQQQQRSQPHHTHPTRRTQNRGHGDRYEVEAEKTRVEVSRSPEKKVLILKVNRAFRMRQANAALGAGAEAEEDARELSSEGDRESREVSSDRARAASHVARMRCDTCYEYRMTE